MVVKVRKAAKNVERKQRPKEQQDALAGGELPSPDFTPAPTMEESMDMFRRQRRQDQSETGTGRTPQSEQSGVTGKLHPLATPKSRERAMLEISIKMLRDLGYDDETIKANIPARVLKRIEDRMNNAGSEQEFLELKDERQKMIDKFFEPPSSISPEDRRLGRRPASEEQSIQGRMRQAEFEAGKPRLDSLYFPSGHERAGELTPHGAQRWAEIQAGTLDLTGMEEVRKNQDRQRKKYEKFGLDVLKKPTE